MQDLCEALYLVRVVQPAVAVGRPDLQLMLRQAGEMRVADQVSWGAEVVLQASRPSYAMIDLIRRERGGLQGVDMMARGAESFS